MKPKRRSFEVGMESLKERVEAAIRWVDDWLPKHAHNLVGDEEYRHERADVLKALREASEALGVSPPADNPQVCAFNVAEAIVRDYCRDANCHINPPERELLRKIALAVQAASSGVSPSGGWQQEQCICAAIRLPNGEVWRGHRHDDAIRVAARAPEVTNGDIRDAEQGFITSRNRFVGRKEGAAIQRAAGIASADTLKPVGETLFSEDLYLRDWRSAPPASPSLPNAGSGEPERRER